MNRKSKPMKRLTKFLTVLGLMGIGGGCFGQPHQLLESGMGGLDATAINQGKFLSHGTVHLKTQYPIQHAIGVEVATPFFLSGHLGIGQLSSFYAKSALEFLPEEDESQLKRRELIQDKLKDGFVFEFGVQYHVLPWRNLYAGLNLQIQQFKIQASPQELAEEYDFGDTQGFREEILGLIENVPVLSSFYENTVLSPSLTAIQLEAKVGKRIHFKKMKSVFLDVEVSYQTNLSAAASVNTSSTAGEVLMENFIKPILEEGTEDSFSSFSFPTVGVRISYQIGDKVYR